MEIQEYVEHYLKMPETIKFLGLAFVIVLLAYLILCLYGKMTYQKTLAKASENTLENASIKTSDDNSLCRHLYFQVEKFNELIFSGTSILMFMAGYYLIERFVTAETFVSIWQKYKDFLLLLFIIISCLWNSLLDRVLIRLKYVSAKEIAPLRILGMLYMVMIFCYIKFIYENNNYDFFISYFLGLIVGRFVYFDASVKDFWRVTSAALKNIPVMILALSCTGAMSLYGFTTKYLIKHIGVITNVFFIHLFMCVAIFVLYHFKFVDLLAKCIGKSKN